MNSTKSLLSNQFQSLAIVVLLFTGYITSCGPGNRIGNARKKPRKMSPFVYKQHVPNVSEFTLGASGQPDGAINRGDPRFKDLVENINNAIIFRDEERDGSDRIMSQRCKEKLDILATMVINQWPGNPPEVPPVKVKVKEAWDDNFLHGENSLHYEGRAVDVATSDRDRSKLGLLARLAVEAGFDWVEYESHGHIHCSVKSDSSAAIKSGGCFTGEGMVYVTHVGEIPMADILVGDEVLSMRSDGVLEYSPVISFIDRDEHGYGLFYTFYTESGRYITLTAKHLLYVVKDFSLNLNEVEPLFADRVTVGQHLLLTDNGSLITTAINKISAKTLRGIYAPLTKHGTIVVDGIVASCYAYIENVFIAHTAFAPIRIFNSISQYLPVFSWMCSDSVAAVRNSTNVKTGMHWYANVLYHIGSRLLSTDTLYVH